MMEPAARRVTVIPPSPEYTQKDIRKKCLRVAPYCRVSTDTEEQLNSYEAQIEYYKAKVAENPDWTLVRLYADEGITGTSMKKRKEFLKLIEDCKKGMIDLVITKSVTRFARNTLEGIQTVRELRRLGIGVFFEKEGTNTLYMDNEMVLTFFFSQAQAESESLSNNVRWGHRKNFQDGKVYYQYKNFLGYRRGPDGQPEIDVEQAAIVRRIYTRYLLGDSVRTICRGLEEDGIRTVHGNTNWTDSTVRAMLQNEKYIGDALLQKTYISDIFNRQVKKNHGELPKYYVHNCHPAIIDRETFQKVQEEMARRGSIRKRAPKAKTEQGHYSGKYALSELLICGECGNTYRRQQYVIKGQRIPVWRCLNRLESGKRICKQSPTFREADLHAAIVAAMNQVLPLGAPKAALRESIVLALAANEPTETLPGIESKIHAIQERQISLLRLATNDGNNEEFDEELGRLHTEKMRLTERREELLLAKKKNAAIDHRIDELDVALGQTCEGIAEYNDVLARQLIRHIKVRDKMAVAVCFKDGMEVVQEIKAQADSK